MTGFFAVVLHVLVQKTLFYAESRVNCAAFRFAKRIILNKVFGRAVLEGMRCYGRTQHRVAHNEVFRSTGIRDGNRDGTARNQIALKTVLHAGALPPNPRSLSLLFPTKAKKKTKLTLRLPRKPGMPLRSLSSVALSCMSVKQYNCSTTFAYRFQDF